MPRVVGGNVEEWLFPGVHSDVGGGYAPGNQGRSRGGHAALLSQIPLVRTYRLNEERDSRRVYRHPLRVH
ncbi:hypothetical protein [Cupriavidus malaysiensis]|uniref:hypothetical protein n=1 Tax=Cupriavidus malaysiensis TaxID=367825 RepID=UPI000A9C706D